LSRVNLLVSNLQLYKKYSSPHQFTAAGKTHKLAFLLKHYLVFEDNHACYMFTYFYIYSA